MKKILQITIAFLCFNLAGLADNNTEEWNGKIRQEINYRSK